MDNHKLASLALFRELYNSGKDAYMVLASFIEYLLNNKKKTEFTVTEINNLLREVFEFSLPDAVIEYAVRKKLNLRKNNLHLYQYNLYENYSDSKNEINNMISAKNQATEIVLSKLFEYYTNVTNNELTDEIKSQLSKSLYAFLLDKKDDYSYLISGLILKEQNNKEFSDYVDTMREGVLLYCGIKFTSPDKPMGVWKSPMTIYLETEILFSAYGYNGELKKELFDEFYNLVLQINSGQEKPIIVLKYFEDTKIDVDSYFNAAKEIITKHKSVDVGKSAMPKILDGCEVVSDVQDKASLFYKYLADKSIIEETGMAYYTSLYHGYLLDDEETIDYYATKYEGNGNTEQILKLLNYINIRRKGVNSNYFDDIGYVLLTEKSITMSMVVDEKIRAIAPTFLATNLHFITNRLWFRLNKGFGNNELPHSFSVIASAQIILSSQINNSISKSYRLLQKEISEGKKTEEEIRVIYSGYRNEVKNPEEINENDVDDIISTILSDDNMEKHLREQELLKQRLSDSESENKIVNILLKKNNDEIASLRQEIERLHKTQQEEKNAAEEEKLRIIRKDITTQRQKKRDKLRKKRRNCRICRTGIYIFIAIGLNIYIFCRWGSTALSITLSIISVTASVVLGIGCHRIKKHFKK